MSSGLAKKLPIFSMAQCPNCGYAIDQLGMRTHCAKCGKQLTIRCISCQAHNPPIFQFCLKCGSDYRMFALIYYSDKVKQLDKQLVEYQHLYYQRARLQLLKRLSYCFVLVLSLAVCYFSLLLFSWKIASPIILSLALGNYILLTKFLTPWLSRLIGISYQTITEWRQVSLIAKKWQGQKNELQPQLAYYQEQFNQFQTYHLAPSSTEHDRETC